MGKPGPHTADVFFRLSAPAKDALAVLTQRTRVVRSEYMREAVEDLLAKYDGARDVPPPMRTPRLWTDGNHATHFYARAPLREALRELSLHTRIAQSKLLHEAMADVLRKHAPRWADAFLEDAPHPAACWVESCRGPLFRPATAFPKGEGTALCCLACDAPYARKLLSRGGR